MSIEPVQRKGMIMEAEKRRREINLITIGTGVILFGLWTVIKIALSNILIGIKIDGVMSDDLILLINIVLWVFVGIDFLARCYIGFSARAEGKGKHKNIFYLILTGLMVATYSSMIPLEISAIFTSGEDVLNMIITIGIDITSIAFLVELMINSIGLRKIKKLQSVKGEQV